MSDTLNKETIAEGFRSLQDEICLALEQADGTSSFTEDLWERPGGGGGRTRIIQNGDLIEKGGVNFSAVHGETSEELSKAMDMPKENFFATGVSIVLHPRNPHVPIIHMNVRYFQLGEITWWFGGGIDLTPHYIDPDEARSFHLSLKQVCDKHDPGYYHRFSQWADQYFYIKHRKETRGVGGIFFDRLGSEAGSRSELFDFALDVGKTFAPLWTSLAEKKRSMEFGEKELNWQLLRRGRYVEFNLVYDKGTRFGLETDGRIESILMSLPAMAGWQYDFRPAEGSAEDRTLNYLRNKMNWLE